MFEQTVEVEYTLCNSQFNTFQSLTLKFITALDFTLLSFVPFFDQFLSEFFVNNFSLKQQKRISFLCIVDRRLKYGAV